MELDVSIGLLALTAGGAIVSIASAFAVVRYQSAQYEKKFAQQQDLIDALNERLRKSSDLVGRLDERLAAMAREMTEVRRQLPNVTQILATILDKLRRAE